MLGQEPYAVVQKHVDRLEQDVLDEFGKDHQLGGVVSLEQLGLKEFPINATGKIMKIELKEEVDRYLQGRA